MKNLTLLILIMVCVLAASGQSTRRKKNDSPVKQVVSITERASSSTKASAFTAATASNVTLRNELTWTFGGKQQRGWYLYDLLINKTLDSEHDTSTNEFAATLASWQKKRGLSADGVLNENSLMALVSQWQSNRLKVRTPATPDQLITAPPSDFYDPSRAPELRQVERNTYEAYKRMIAAAAADPELKLGQYFKIVSAFRSREYQDELRRKSPNAGSAGLAVNNSPHFTGRALDLYVGGSPVDTKDSNRAIQVNTPAYRWLVRNAERFGFRPYFYEPWHWEYVK
jgi:zinc D-Ala-D-Ala carboxypeptidase